MTFLRLFALPLACLAFGSPVSAAGAGGARAIVGNTVHGNEGDGEFYDYYAPNGNATSMLNGGDITHGHWSIQKGSMCIAYPSDTPTCYRIEMKSGVLDMTDVSTGAVFHNQLLRGNPKHL